MGNFSAFDNLAPSSGLNCKLSASALLPHDSTDPDGQCLSRALFCYEVRFSGYNAKTVFRRFFAKINQVPSPRSCIVLAAVSGFDRGSCRPTPASAGFSPSVQLLRPRLLPSVPGLGRPLAVRPGHRPRFSLSAPASTGASAVRHWPRLGPSASVSVFDSP